MKVEEIKSAIENLSYQDFQRIKSWIDKIYWQKWDKEIEEHSIKGSLDFLIEEALEEKRKNELREL